MPAEGSVLSGRYRLISRLGRGGMGAVWRAEHLGLSSHVAIKLIDEEVVQSEETLGRFQREAQAAASLRMSNIVQILDYGVDEQTPYIAMELLEGETLSSRLERGGPLSAAQTATIISQVGRALAKAHEAGIVHRDLKPDNVFLVADGDQEIAKVLDFGIAKTTNQDPERVLLNTTTGAMLGTPYYMSPEQATAQGDVDHLSDVWALGVLAFECMTGRRPFDGPSIGAIVLAICSAPLPIPSQFGEVPLGFDAWFQTACSRDKAARFRSASGATASLRRLCGVDYSRSSISSFPPISLRELAGSGEAGGSPGAPAQSFIARASTAPPTILGGTPDPALLADAARANGARRRLVVAVAGGAVALGLLALSLAAAREDDVPPSVVASDPGGKTEQPDEGGSPVVDEALSLDDLTPESREEAEPGGRTARDAQSARGKRGTPSAPATARWLPSAPAPAPSTVPASDSGQKVLPETQNQQAPAKKAPEPDVEQRLAF